MTATAADTGYGTILKKGNADGPPETFTDLGLEITSINPPGFKRDMIDATHMQSANQIREKIAGMMEWGECTIDFAWVPATSDPLVTAIKAGFQNWQIALPDGSTTWTFSGAFSNYQPTAPLDGKMTATATLTPTGDVTIA